MDQRCKYVGLCGLYVLYCQIFRVIDKKLFKSIWDVYKKAPAVHLIGNVVWIPSDFLLSNIPDTAQAIDKKALLAVRTHCTSWLQQRNQTLIR